MISACAEVGLGAGGGVGLSTGGAKRSGTTAHASLGAGCGPFGVGGTVEIDDCGNFTTEGELSGGVASGQLKHNHLTGKTEPSGKLAWNKSADQSFAEAIINKVKCKIGGKVAAVGCVGAR